MFESDEVPFERTRQGRSSVTCSHFPAPSIFICSRRSMESSQPFDFNYAVENTRVVKAPSAALETFGTTRINYYLVTELMDSIGEVRVREGRMEAAQPTIVTPGNLQSAMIDGFEDEEAAKYVQWLREHAPDLHVLHYGFTISKQDVKSYVLHDTPEQVVDNVLSAVKEKQDDFSAVLIGVDKPWEVCLLKLMVELVEKSVGKHVQQMQQRNMLPNPGRDREEVEMEFSMAERDHSRIPYLHKRLQAKGVFAQYEDRFYALVKAAKGLR